MSGPFPETAGAWLRAASDALAAAGKETPALDARMLLLDGLRIPHSVIIADPELVLTQQECAHVKELVDRRLAGEPVSRILGVREFWGRKFQVNPDVLDPRPDTETLIEAVLEFGDQDTPIRFLEIGTGSGCIAVTLLAERKNWIGTATDISPAALEVAQANAKHHSVAERLSLVETSWADAVDGCFDVICSNPPYIPSDELSGLAPEVRDHDPRLALDGGNDGLDAYRAIAKTAPKLLAAGGMMMLEIGADQKNDVQKAMERAHLRHIRTKRDLAGHDRVVIVQHDETGNVVEDGQL